MTNCVTILRHKLERSLKNFLLNVLFVRCCCCFLSAGSCLCALQTLDRELYRRRHATYLSKSSW